MNPIRIPASTAIIKIVLKIYIKDNETNTQTYFEKYKAFLNFKGESENINFCLKFIGD